MKQFKNPKEEKNWSFNCITKNELWINL